MNVKQKKYLLYSIFKQYAIIKGVDCSEGLVYGNKKTS